ncbi:hypothetical protein [uncultured Alistipes sp.]|uniref:hypothetical protein n=1 Tax=uncultured Alistipes sp. TaxID=538949 RepID=UPI0025D35B63|nr:hypothetical protein [uncultured Alistipes sp.]
MKKIVLSLLLSIMILPVWATAQDPDMIIYNGKLYSLFTNPMEKYFREHPTKRPSRFATDSNGVGISSSSNWRGYRATFWIKDDQLFLKDIMVEVEDRSQPNGIFFGTKWISVLDKVFPGSPIVKLDWLTGILVIPEGELVDYVHMGYASTFSHYILLEFHEGNLTSRREYDHREYEAFRNRQFEIFSMTDEYKKRKEELMKEGGYYSNERHAEEFLKEVYSAEYTSIILAD